MEVFIIFGLINPIQMTASKLSLLIGLFFLFSLKTFAQDDPPPMAMPKANNTLLIDKIIEVTKHERYFVDYCTEKVIKYAKDHNWTKEKTDKILGSIQFKGYSYTIYNSYAFYSTDKLKRLIEVLTLLNTGAKNEPPMILTNSMMQKNLDLFVEGVIEGRYMTNK